jgi:hypothetical protein
MIGGWIQRRVYVVQESGWPASAGYQMRYLL